MVVSCTYGSRSVPSWNGCGHAGLASVSLVTLYRRCYVLGQLIIDQLWFGQPISMAAQQAATLCPSKQ